MHVSLACALPRRSPGAPVLTTTWRRIAVVASTVIVVACGRERPGPPPVMATTAPSTADAATPAAADLTTTLVPDAAPPGPSAPRSPRPSPTEPATIFRRISAGMLPSTGLRETWTLSRHGAVHVLQLSADESTRNIVIDGHERDESSWQKVGGATWSASGDLSALGLRLEESHGAWGRARGPGRTVPDTLTMHCKASKLPVLSGVAVLVHGDACGNGGPRPHWMPKATVTVAIERCTFDELPQDEHAQKWEGIPSFAREPGVEFVFDNSDCSAQEGAYRWIGSAKR